MASYYVHLDDGTDDLSAGRGDSADSNAWLTIAYALETGIPNTGKDTTNGDRLYITGGATTSETLAKTWDINTWIGGYGDHEALELVGYQTTADDGVAHVTIIGTSTYQIKPGIGFVCRNINFQSNGAGVTNAFITEASGTNVNAQWTFVNCKFERTVDVDSAYISGNFSGVKMFYCSIFDWPDNAVIDGAINIRAGVWDHCVFDRSVNFDLNAGRGLSKNGFESAVVQNCIFRMSGNNRGCIVARSNMTILNNSFVTTAGVNNSKFAISGTPGDGLWVVANNIFSGWNTTSSSGISSGTSRGVDVYYNNSFYDCTSTIISSGAAYVDVGNETLSVDPFTDAANGDFTPVDTGSIKEGSYPGQFPDI